MNSDLFCVRHVADSFARLRGLSDGCADHIITDPPYDAHCHGNMSSGTAMRAYVNGEITGGGIPRVDVGFDPLDGYEFVRDMVRASRRWVLSFCTLEAFGDMRRVAGSGWVRAGVWVKTNAMGQLTGDRPAAAYEGVGIMHRAGKRRWNGRGSYAVWLCNGTRGENGRHPSQKPLSLCIELVRKFTDPGELILDPFCGSGRIGEAALLCGRRYEGWDANEEWVEKAHSRLTKAAGVYGSADCGPLNTCGWST